LTDVPTVTGLSAQPRPSGDAALPRPTAAPADGGRTVDLITAERVVEQLLAHVPAGTDTTRTRHWLRAVDLLLDSAGERDRARLLQARAAVRDDGARDGQRGAIEVRQDAAAAAELFERLGEPLAAARNFAVAATAAVRSGDIALALETAVRALVAFDATAPEAALETVPEAPEAAPEPVVEATPDAGAGAATAGDTSPEPATEKPVERDPAGEAHLATMLGVLCHHFFDYPRALRFYELALAGPHGPGDAQRWSSAMHYIAEVLLAQAREAGRSGWDGEPRGGAEQDRDVWLDRAEELARRLIADGSPSVIRTVDGPRLLAIVLCERGRPEEAWPLLQRAREQLTASGDPGRSGVLHLATGRCMYLLGRPDEAVAELDAALALLAAELDLAERILALRLRSLARQAAGDVEGALADARRLADLLWSRHQRQVGGFMDQLWSRAGAEGERRDLEARAQALLRTAEQDPLTGLANRRAVERFCGQIRSGTGVCLVLVDVDDFKGVNDRHGHAIGDAVLRALATLLTRSVRSVDVVARWGGEEFLIALPGGSGTLGTDAAARVCSRVREHPWHRLAPGLRVTVSAGVASGPVPELDAVLGRADEAMYRAKKAGRDRAVAG